MSLLPATQVVTLVNPLMANELDPFSQFACMLTQGCAV